jgi:hypothetical protein
MNFTLPLIVGVVVLLLFGVGVIVILRTRSGGKDGGDIPAAYQTRAALFTPAERSFAGVLDGVLPDGITWMGKVRLGDVFDTRKGLSASQRARAWNRITQKHTDFLLVRVSDFAPVAGIELDDSSHQEARRKERDVLVGEVFRSGGLPLIHVRAQSAYNRAELAAKIAQSLTSTGVGTRDAV